MNEAQALIDSLEADIQRMRIDDALKASMVAKLDALRGLKKPADAHDVYSRPECIFNYCSAPSMCKRLDKCINCR